MFGLGPWEIGVILVVALLVLGPSKLPELAKGLGKGLREFKKATSDFKSTMDDELYRPEQIPPATNAELLPPQPLIATSDPLKQAEAAQQAEAAKPIATPGTGTHES